MSPSNSIKEFAMIFPFTTRKHDTAGSKYMAELSNNVAIKKVEKLSKEATSISVLVRFLEHHTGNLYGRVTAMKRSMFRQRSENTDMLKFVADTIEKIVQITWP